MLFSHLGEGLCQPFWACKSNNSSHLNSITEFIKPFHIYYTFDPQQPGESRLICVIIPFYSSGEVKCLVQTVELLGVSQHFEQHSGSRSFRSVHRDAWEQWCGSEQKSLRPLYVEENELTSEMDLSLGSRDVRVSYNPVLTQPVCPLRTHVQNKELICGVLLSEAVITDYMKPMEVTVPLETF